MTGDRSDRHGGCTSACLVEHKEFCQHWPACDRNLTQSCLTHGPYPACAPVLLFPTVFLSENSISVTFADWPCVISFDRFLANYALFTLV